MTWCHHVSGTHMEHPLRNFGMGAHSQGIDKGIWLQLERVTVARLLVRKSTRIRKVRLLTDLTHFLHHYHDTKDDKS